jgi:predicted dehydrogenase
MNVDEFLSRDINRRRFLGHGAAGAAGMAATAVGIARARADSSPSNTINIGVIGVRSQGKALAVETAQMPGTRVVAVCDVDESMGQRAGSAVQDVQGLVPRQVRDFRRILDDPDVDAVIIATPDHWHALMTILACQAGKDVYVEKPASQTIAEGRRMIAAAESHRRVVQCGLQQRSGEHFRSAIAALHAGQIGKVRLARAWSVHRRQSIGCKPDGTPPKSVDYDLWLGPAAASPFNVNRFHYHWRWNWDYGTGELGNWGTHLLDIARWGLNEGLPERISSSGGKLYFEDDQQTPDTLTVTYSYPTATIVWEHRLWTQHGIEGRSAAVAFYGDDGTLIVDRSGWKVYDRRESLTAGASELRQAHLANFFDAVRTRSGLNCDLQTGHISSTLSHLGNISHRVGRELRLDAESGTFAGDEAANQLLSREYRGGFDLPHLS